MSTYENKTVQSTVDDIAHVSLEISGEIQDFPITVPVDAQTIKAIADLNKEQAKSRLMGRFINVFSVFCIGWNTVLLGLAIHNDVNRIPQKDSAIVPMAQISIAQGTLLAVALKCYTDKENKTKIKI